MATDVRGESATNQIGLLPGSPFILDEQSGILAMAPPASMELKSEVAEFVSEDEEELLVDAEQVMIANAAGLSDRKQQGGAEITAIKRSRRKAQQPRRLDSQGSAAAGGQRSSSGMSQDADLKGEDDEEDFAQLLTPQQELKVGPGLKTRSAGKVPCNVCGRSFASRYMTSHMRVHKDEVGDIFTGDVATASSSSSPGIRRSKRQASKRPVEDREEEEQTEEDDDGRPVGPENLLPKKGRGRPPNNANSSSKLYECYVCDRSFSKSAMPAHMRTHEAGGHHQQKASKDRAASLDAEKLGETDTGNNSSAADADEAEDVDGDGGDEVSFTGISRPVSRRKLKKFPCDICGKSFDRYYLLEHMHSHARKMSRALAKSHKGDPKLKKTTRRKKPRLLERLLTEDTEDNKQAGSSGDDKTGSSDSPAEIEDADDDNENDDENEDDEDEEDDDEGAAGDSSQDAEGGDDDDDCKKEDKKKKKKKTSKEKRARRQRPKFPCDVCGSLFNKYYMVIHLRSHTGEKPFTCSACDKQFVSSNSLTSHTNNCHGEQRGKVQCDICGRLVSSKMSLRQHLRTHSEEKPYQCHVCGKSFKQCAQLSAHVKTHADGMPYQCEACGHRYKSVTGLIRHREYHHLGIRKKYPCELCGKSFTRHSKLRDHLMWHRGTSPYVCKYCGKRLLSRKTLNTHILIHEDLKPYKCNVCGKSFRQNCVLKRHLTVHTGIKPFRCDLCGKQFIHRVYLVKHTCDVQQDGNRTFLAL